MNNAEALGDVEELTGLGNRLNALARYRATHEELPEKTSSDQINQLYDDIYARVEQDVRQLTERTFLQRREAMALESVQLDARAWTTNDRSFPDICRETDALSLAGRRFEYEFGEVSEALGQDAFVIVYADDQDVSHPSVRSEDGLVQLRRVNQDEL